MTINKRIIISSIVPVIQHGSQGLCRLNLTGMVAKHLYFVRQLKLLKDANLLFLKTNPSRAANFANRPQFYDETLYMYLPIHETLQLQLKVVKVSCQEVNPPLNQTSECINAS